MKTLIIISLFLFLTSYSFACNYCETNCPYEQAKAEQQFRFYYEYREIIYSGGYLEEHRLRQELRNRRRREILNYKHYNSGGYRGYIRYGYGYGHSLNRPYYNNRYGGSLKGGSY